MIANITSRRSDIDPVRQAVDNNALVQQPCGERLAGYLVRMGHRIPEWRQRPPVRFGKRAFARGKVIRCQQGRGQFRRMADRKDEEDDMKAIMEADEGLNEQSSCGSGNLSLYALAAP